MATCNFSLRYNSDFLYAFCESSDFEKYLEDYKQANDFNEDEEDEDSLREALYSDWYDDEKEYYIDWLEEELNKLTAYGTGLESDFTGMPSRKITDGDELAQVWKNIQFAGGEFTVMAAIDFEAGYYEGFALDWRIKSITGNYGGYDFDCMPDREDCRELLADNTDLNEGLQKALADKLQARLEAALDDVTGAIEKALKTISPYHLTGVCASNGEGFYFNHKNDDKAA